MSRIMGIDVGFANTGWAIFDLVPGRGLRRLLPVAAGCIRTERETGGSAVRVADDDARRVGLTVRAIANAVRGFGVRALFAELPTGAAQGARANRAMGIASGAMVTLAELLELPVEWITPTMVKKLATGQRTASKTEVQEVVGRQWPELEPMSRKLGKRLPMGEWEHIADAAMAAGAGMDGQLMRSLERRVG